MSTLTLRTVKGAPLTNLEVDTNFSNLNTDKIESSDAVSTNTANKVVKRDSSGNFSAGVITATGLNGAKFTSYKEAVTTATVSTTTYNIDLSLSNIFDITLGNNVTFTFTNPPSSGTAVNCTVILRQDATGSRTATFTNAKYTDGVAPVLTTTANSIDILSFFTVNGGSSYFGSFSMANVS